MMQVNEIRIGNWIYYNGKLSKIDLTDFRDILEDNYEINYYKPIPLNEEILLKCGFVKFTTKDIYPTYANNLFNWNNGVLYLIGYGFMNNIKYLHQLQNLYFALTGKELTYNSIV